MLWHLHLCAEASTIMISDLDQAVGTMVETENSDGRFAEVVLKPVVIVAPGTDRNQAEQLHKQAHHFCFIANSVNFQSCANLAFKLKTNPIILMLFQASNSPNHL